MRKFDIIASDGAHHLYPEGFKIIAISDWLYIQDEDGKLIAVFYKPIAAIMQ